MNDQTIRDQMLNFSLERLDLALKKKPTDEEGKAAYQQALSAFNAYIEMAKVDDAHEEQTARRELEERKMEREEAREAECQKKQRRHDIMLKGIEIGAMVLVAPLIKHICNRSNIKLIGQVEQMEMFTSTPGRTLGKMFDWR